MKNLRELLNFKNPELYTALENAWDVAHNEIFPALPASGESLNSYPHVRNLENYLNTILPCDEILFNPKSPIHLTPYELYAMLASILFHDIGRVISNDGHGTYSSMQIIENRRKYCIPSKEMAYAIADICEYHENLEFESKKKYTSILLDADKGYIRVKELGSLLVLVDEMDHTYNRLTSLDEKKQSEYNEAKSIFRNIIKGVTYNKEAKAIVISIDEHEVEKQERSIRNAERKKLIKPIYSNNTRGCYLKYNGYKERDEEFSHKEYHLFNHAGLGIFESKKEVKNYRKKLWGIIKYKVRVEIKKLEKGISGVPWIILRHLEKDLSFTKKEITEKNSENFKIKDIGTLRKFLPIISLVQERTNLKDNEKKIINDLWARIQNTMKIVYPPEIILSIALSSINNSREKFEKKCDELNRLGIYVDKWLIYYKEHLYNPAGYETIEPIFDEDYLILVLNCMLKLSKNVIGQKEFTYKMLAAEVIEEDFEKIKMAVQRLSILQNSDKQKFKIEYNSERWCLSTDENKTSTVKSIAKKTSKDKTKNEKSEGACQIIDEIILQLSESNMPKK